MITMKLSAIAKLVLPGVAAVAGVLSMALWLRGGSPDDLGIRLPGQSGRPVKAAVTRPNVFPGHFVRGEGKPANFPGTWPSFRGANCDGIASDSVPLARKWPAEGPRKFWSAKLGRGYAAPAVMNGRVYLLDYDEKQQADTMRCLSLADGREIWRVWYPVRIRENHGMSRTVPAVTEKHVVSLGPKCHVMCLDAVSGEFRWGVDLVNKYGTKVPGWYAGQCPLIDDGRVILAPGGSALMVALKIDTGKVVWETPNPAGWQMTHSSIVPMDLDGRRTYVYCASGGVVGVDAETGRVLWRWDKWRIHTNCPSPVIVPGSRIFLSGGYGAGSMMIRIRKTGGAFVAEKLFRLKPKQFASEQQTPIFYKDHLYGIPPNGSGAISRQLVCIDLDGKLIWSSGKTDRIGPRGAGPYIIADGLVFALGDNGTLTIAEATGEGFRLLDRAKVLDGHDAWGPMALAGGRLLVRDFERMVCLDVAAPAKRP